MLDFYSYEGLRNGATFVVDATTKETLTDVLEIVGKAVTITGNGEVGYGKNGDIPLGFVEQVEKEYTNSDRLAVSVVWYQSKEEIQANGASAGDILVCDGSGGLKKLDEGFSTAYVFATDGETAAVYIGGMRMANGSVDVGNPKVSRYGFAHDASKVNSTINVKDGATDTFWVIFDRPVGKNKYEFDLKIEDHTYTVVADNLTETWTKLYWKLGTSKDDTQIDKVDGEPVEDFSEDWPTVPTTAEMTLKYQGGGTVYGANSKPMTKISMALDTTNVIDNKF